MRPRSEIAPGTGSAEILGRRLVSKLEASARAAVVAAIEHSLDIYMRRAALHLVRGGRP